ncbi:MAG: non-canonical purine NTP pyrophosphatase [Alkalispirochaeta sp.]
MHTTILLASNNAHKRTEMEGILSLLNAPVQVAQPKDFDFSFDVEETADTFSGNSLIKARALFRLTKGELSPGVTCSEDAAAVPNRLFQALGTRQIPVLADDSGICVHALDDRPGVYSARFGDEPGKPPLSDEDRNDLLLKTLRDTRDRGAHYVCNATLILDAERWIQVEETWHGAILRERAPGTTGFGYDPIVWLEEYGSSVAQLPQEKKDHVSHRAKALRRICAAAGWVDSV